MFSDEIISSTDLKNNQKKWFDYAQKAPVSITNRHGRNFVLINREQIKNAYHTSNYAKMIIQYFEEVDREIDGAAFSSEVFPWAAKLNPGERKEFRHELIESFIESSKTDNWMAIEEIVADWKATSEAISNAKFMDVVKSNPNERQYVEID